MTHDPYQTQYQMHPAFGAYTGLTNPFSSPYPNMQAAGFNPGVYNPLAGNPGQQIGFANYGISPQQLQLASALAAQASQFGVQSPYGNPWQNPVNAIGYQHPAALAGLQNPLATAVLTHLAATLAQQQIAQQQQYGGQQQFAPQSYQQQPFQQPYQGNGIPGQFPQFNAPLAPQSWVGQQGPGQPGMVGQQGQFGAGQPQLNPLLIQALARAVQSQGLSPWSGF